jgi:tetratricopeptide (TPR) repeat protein
MKLFATKAMTKALFFALVLFIPIVFAQETASLPSDVGTADYDKFMHWKKDLDAAREKVTEAQVDLRDDCSDVLSNDTVKIGQCKQERKDVVTKMNDYKRDLAAYEQALKDAQSKSKATVSTSKDLHNAASFMKERLAVTRSRAKAFAAWKLGAYLLDNHQTDLALQYLKEARRFYADPDSHEYDALNRLIYDPRAQEPMSFLNELFPADSFKAEAMLDALDYGNGNWDESIKYLEVAHQANPNDLAVRDALNYMQGIVAGRQDKGR